MNGFRIAVTALALAGLILTLTCPWWRYRQDADLGAVYQSGEALDQFMKSSGHESIATSALETHVGMKPIWEIGGYEVHDWLPFNLIQAAGIIAAWGWGLSYARQFDKSTVTATVTN